MHIPDGRCFFNAIAIHEAESFEDVHQGMIGDENDGFAAIVYGKIGSGDIDYCAKSVSAHSMTIVIMFDVHATNVHEAGMDVNLRKDLRQISPAQVDMRSQRSKSCEHASNKS